MQELEGVGIRLNKEPPNIVVKKKERGGMNFSTTTKLTHLNEDLVRTILQEYRILSAGPLAPSHPFAIGLACGCHALSPPRSSPVSLFVGAAPGWPLALWADSVGWDREARMRGSP